MIRNLTSFQSKVKKAQRNLKKIDIIISKLADIAMETIKQSHDRIISEYSSAFDPTTKHYNIDKFKSDNGWIIEVEGESVLFVEYGTGVHFNPVPVERPSGISNIGEYGLGKGKNDTWTYEIGGTGLFISTHGNPAAVGIPNALREMREAIPRLIRELWND